MFFSLFELFLDILEPTSLLLLQDKLAGKNGVKRARSPAKPGEWIERFELKNIWFEYVRIVPAGGYAIGVWYQNRVTVFSLEWSVAFESVF